MNYTSERTDSATIIFAQPQNTPPPLTANEQNLLFWLVKREESRIASQTQNPLRLQLHDLIAALGMSRSTVQRAIRSLVGKGYVKTSRWKGSRDQDRGSYFHLDNTYIKAVSGVVNLASPGVVKNKVDQAYLDLDQDRSISIKYTSKCGGNGTNNQTSQSALGCVQKTSTGSVLSRKVLPSNAKTNSVATNKGVLPSNGKRKPRTNMCAYPHPGCPVHPHALTVSQKAARAPSAKVAKKSNVQIDNDAYMAWIALYGNIPTKELIQKGIAPPPKYNRCLMVVHGNYRGGGNNDLPAHILFQKPQYLKDAPKWFKRAKTPEKAIAAAAWWEQKKAETRKQELYALSHVARGVVVEIHENFDLHWQTLFRQVSQKGYIRTPSVTAATALHAFPDNTKHSKVTLTPRIAPDAYKALTGRLDKTACVPRSTCARDVPAKDTREPSMTASSDRKDRLQLLIADTAVAGPKARQAQQARRVQRKAHQTPVQDTGSATLEPLKEKEPKTKEPKGPNKNLNLYRIKGLWTDLWKQSFRNLPVPAWDKSNSVIVFQLLDLYPIEDIERMIKFVLLNWDGVRKQLKLTGTAPNSINIVRKLHAVLLIESVAWYAAFEKNMQEKQEKTQLQDSLVDKFARMGGS